MEFFEGRIIAFGPPLRDLQSSNKKAFNIVAYQGVFSVLWHDDYDEIMHASNAQINTLYPYELVP